MCLHVNYPFHGFAVQSLDLVKAVRWKRVRGSVTIGFRALHQHLGVRSGVSLIVTLQPVIVLAMI